MLRYSFPSILSLALIAPRYKFSERLEPCLCFWNAASIGDCVAAELGLLGKGMDNRGVLDEEMIEMTRGSQKNLY